jgi:gliding motility-associated-like protein
MRYCLLFLLIFPFFKADAQQDVEFHFDATFLAGKNIIKVKRDFYDPYLWVLAQNNEVFRINSITKAVDDYTFQFRAFSNYKFIDIAGRSGDTVYIATSTQAIIQYQKGAFKIITTAVPGNVNSIGLDYTERYLTDNTYGGGGRPQAKSLTIGTEAGMCHYDIINETMLPGASTVPGRVFESTYRSNTFSDLEIVGYQDVVNQYNVITLNQFTTFGGYLFYDNGGKYGQNINTAYCTDGEVRSDIFSGYINGYNMEYYWGTEKGLFQINRGYSYHSTLPQKHYLDGLNVNKITSIYGLRAFGDSYNRGLIKENLLVGTDDGLYFSNSGYDGSAALFDYTFTHYDQLGNVKINDVCVNATSYERPTCEDGVWVAAVNGLYLLRPDFGAYLSPSTTIAGLVFENQPFDVAEQEICDGTTIKLQVFSSQYGGGHISWYKDGVEILNATGTSLVVDKTGDYSAVFYDPCSTTHIPANHLKVKVVSAPVFSFNYPDEINVCEGAGTILKTDAKAEYQYRWYKNGQLNGNYSAKLDINDAGVYKLEVSGCTNNWVATKEVTVNFISLPGPILSANRIGYCIGEKALLTANVSPGNTYDINWYKDGSALDANKNKTTLLTDAPGNYTVTINSNLTTCVKTSQPVSIGFDSPPTLSVAQLPGSLCNGQTVSLKATYSGGTISWSTGQTTSQINVTQTGRYSATVTTAAGCSTTKDFDIAFLPNPVLNIPDASVCSFADKTATLTAPAGFARYQWNGQDGGSIYTASKAGTVVLIVTDGNGCQASQTINVSSHCDDIYLPNTFTPNGDGSNDNWVVTGMEDDPTTTVKIFNRNGNPVFQHRGSFKQWDGTNNGKKLPAGVYYYLIKAHGGKQTISGYLCIIY